MKSIEAVIADQGVQADPAHLAASAATVKTLIDGTAARFAALPLEAEPSGFEVELRSRAP